MADASPVLLRDCSTQLVSNKAPHLWSAEAAKSSEVDLSYSYKIFLPSLLVHNRRDCLLGLRTPRIEHCYNDGLAYFQ